MGYMYIKALIYLFKQSVIAYNDLELTRSCDNHAVTIRL